MHKSHFSLASAGIAARCHKQPEHTVTFAALRAVAWASQGLTWDAFNRIKRTDTVADT